MNEKFTIVIIDDEEYVIDGLKRHVNWDRLNVKIIGTASDGMMGYDLITEVHPDVVITDIYMPEMNGMQMIKKINENKLFPKFIVFTGYDEFELARKSILYKVSEYILKPSLPKDIEESIEKVLNECRAEREQKHEMEALRERFEKEKKNLIPRFINNILNGRLKRYEEFTQENSFFELSLDAPWWCVLSLNLNGTYETFGELTVEEQVFKLYQIFSFAVSVLPSGTVGNGFENNICSFIIPLENNDEESSRSIYEGAKQIISYCEEVHGISGVIGIGSVVELFDEIPQAYQESKNCVKDSCQEDPIIHITEFQKLNPSCANFPFPEKNRIIDALFTGDSNEARSQIQHLFERIAKIKSARDSYVIPLLFELIGTTSIELFQKGILIEPASLLEVVRENRTLAETCAKVLEFFEYLFDQLQNRQTSKNYQIVKKVIEQIQSDYMKNPSLNEIAEKLQLTPNYLSTVFSKSLGMSFSHYCTRFKMEKAKKLLESGTYKVYEVAQLAGYNNTEYFSKIFKDTTGVVPSEYMRKYL